MVWKEIYTDARIRTGITPKVKGDYEKIMIDAITKVNADEKVKDMLLSYLSYGLSAYKSASSYKRAAVIPATFVQWLSEKRKKRISLIDLEFPNTTSEDAISFANAYSPGVHLRAQIKSYLITFSKYLVSGRYPISKDPFMDLEIDMPDSERTIVYNEEELDDFYNVLMFGAPRYYTLFFRLLMETGQRPISIYYLTCKDIEYDKPQQDALGRTFYPIFARAALVREKQKIGETLSRRKRPAVVVYISEQLKNDIVTWCEDNKLTGEGYIFKNNFARYSYNEFISDRKENPKYTSGLKHKDTYYIFYGLRHTWTSVMYSITNVVGDLIDLGGWSAAGVPLEIYRAPMKQCPALAIAKKWNIYLHPDREDKVLELQGKCERREPVPGAPTVTTEQMANVLAIIETLQKKIEVLEKEKEKEKRR